MAAHASRLGSLDDSWMTTSYTGYVILKREGLTEQQVKILRHGEQVVLERR